MFYPVSLDLKGRCCVVVGGGRVAERKVRTLLASGARVRVISPVLTAGLAALADEAALAWVDRNYRPGDLSGAFLVIAATDDTEVQRQAHDEARAAGLLINVADVPQLCNFILPAIVRQGDLTVAISTGGKSPALAKKLRLELEARFGPEYKLLIELLGCLRPLVLARGRPSEENEATFNRLLHKDLAAWIREGRWQQVQAHLSSVLGEGFDASMLEQLRKSSG